MCSGGGFGGEDSRKGVTKSSGVVAAKGSFGWGRRYDVVAVDGRISEKGFVRERKQVSKTFGNNGSWKVNILFRFSVLGHPSRCSGRFEGDHPWRWVDGGLGPEESFKGANSSDS